RGTGTRTTSLRTEPAISSASTSAAAATPRYLRWWTRARAVPRCRYAGEMTPSSGRYCSGAGHRSARQRSQSCPSPRRRHVRQITPATYPAPPTRRAAAGRSGRSLLPAGQVGALLVGQLLEAAAQAGEFDRSDFPVDLLRQRVDARLEVVAVLDQPLGGERLVRERHVHHVGGMPFRRPEVH